MQWHPEVVSQCPGIPFLLVGTKLDLREDNKKMQSSQEEGVTPLTFSEVLMLARLMLHPFTECAKFQRQIYINVNFNFIKI